MKRTWRKRVAEARQRVPPSFTEADLSCAASWATCAVGEAREKNPGIIRTGRRELPMAPTDEELWVLGDHFYILVRDHDVERAAQLLGQIDAAVSRLKGER